MEHQEQGLTRRRALGLGVSAVGAWMALKGGAAWAQPAPGTAAPASGSAVRDVSDAGWETVEAALGGTRGKLGEAGVFRVDLPRSDLQVTLFGIAVKPEMGIATAIIFWRAGSTTVMKYELALLEAEVNPALISLFARQLVPSGSNFTALHNHFQQVSPNVMFLHGAADGDPVAMAQALHTVLATTTRTPFGHAVPPPGDSGLDVHAIQGILGGTGELRNGVLTVSVPRAETPQENGIRLPAAMMFESTASFQSVGGLTAAMTAEMVVLPNEAAAAARQLHNYGIDVTALHNHELGVAPNFYYLHAFGSGPVFRLARGIRAALSVTNSVFR